MPVIIMHGRTDKPTRKGERSVQGPSNVYLRGFCESQAYSCSGCHGEVRNLRCGNCTTSEHKYLKGMYKIW